MTIDTIDTQWDLVVIGGGITGAGLLREAVRNGLKTLLVEQDDFAWGTSSRSSKLVHGGLRYLKEGQLMLTIESVNERERLLNEAEGLVEPLDFLFPIYKNQSPGRWTMKAGLTIYDVIARKLRHKWISADTIRKDEPVVRTGGLKGGFRFMDAQVDDARLVLRLIIEAVAAGGSALNYTRATTINRDNSGRVTGVSLTDSETGITKDVHAKVVVNASGVWAETLHPSPEKNLHIRPLRGSHLIFPYAALPVNDPVSFFHPKDGRAMFAVPWEGSVLLGTTDIDHTGDLFAEPFIAQDEVDYIIDGARFMFPDSDISRSKAVSSMAGVRPVLSQGKIDASKESREHVVWVDKGLVTITGGKLTTFRKLAWDTLKVAAKFINNIALTGREEPVFDPISRAISTHAVLSADQLARLYGRYGNEAQTMIQESHQKDLEQIPGTYTLWVELSHAAKNETVRHLRDLLLRRVRIGLLLPDGGTAHLERIRELCLPHLSWSREKWDEEVAAYKAHWQSYYKVPEVSV